MLGALGRSDAGTSTDTVFSDASSDSIFSDTGPDTIVSNARAHTGSDASSDTSNFAGPNAERTNSVSGHGGRE